MLDDLSRAREGFVLASDLHLVFLVTPINVDVEPNWELYYERFMELSILDQVMLLVLITLCQLILDILFVASWRQLIPCGRFPIFVRDVFMYVESICLVCDM